MDHRPPTHPSSIRLGHSCKDIALSESLSLYHALLPPTPPSSSSEIGGRAGRGVREPGPASRVAALAGCGGHPLAPRAASGPARGSPSRLF